MTKRKANPQRAGRKTNYKPEYDLQAYKFSLLGLTDVEMARLFSVAEKTFDGWKKRYPGFRKSIAEGKELADAEIAHSLNQRAKGYTYIEEVPTKVKEVIYKDGKRLKEVEHVIITKVTRTMPADPNSMRYWMNNRRRKRPIESPETPAEPASWAERHEIDHTTGGEKLPAPQVYLPTDLPEDIMGPMPTTESTS